MLLTSSELADRHLSLVSGFMYKYNDRDLIKAPFSGGSRASDCGNIIPARPRPEWPGCCQRSRPITAESQLLTEIEKGPTTVLKLKQQSRIQYIPGERFGRIRDEQRFI